MKTLFKLVHNNLAGYKKNLEYKNKYTIYVIRNSKNGRIYKKNYSLCINKNLTIFNSHILYFRESLCSLFEESYSTGILIPVSLNEIQKEIFSIIKASNKKNGLLRIICKAKNNYDSCILKSSRVNYLVYKNSIKKYSSVNLNFITIHPKHSYLSSIFFENIFNKVSKHTTYANHMSENLKSIQVSNNNYSLLSSDTILIIHQDSEIYFFCSKNSKYNNITKIYVENLKKYNQGLDAFINNVNIVESNNIDNLRLRKISSAVLIDENLRLQKVLSINGVKLNGDKDIRLFKILEDIVITQLTPDVYNTIYTHIPKNIH
uniref:Uncharacterized protein n=1 Tax=Amorphochlora amoebiformis TaxID=1561963 RepID=A0A0H5BIF5_9EUKA|nr:hypothetical protein [Amorphochlora amoebiformis]|mmetsp:Transcript_3509/g.5364  ORF Transcript_3509/g.5364 Transcript_3509/m.5364 type:complete len:318 (+) Transcript_3509:64-1017(+)